MTNVSVPTEVGPKDQLFITVSGTRNGSGRSSPETLVQDQFNLSEFLEEWGVGGGAAMPSLDNTEMAALAKKNIVAFQNAIAAYAAKMAASTTVRPLPERIVAAVIDYLRDEYDLLISETDPGSDVYYINPADLQPTAHQYPGDGWAWSVFQTAPFGA